MHMGVVLQYNRWVWPILPFFLWAHIGNGKRHIKKTHIKEFQRESGRGSGRQVSGPAFFMLVSFFIPVKHSASRILRGGGCQGLGGGLRSNLD